MFDFTIYVLNTNINIIKHKFQNRTNLESKFVKNDNISQNSESI